MNKFIACESKEEFIEYTGRLVLVQIHVVYQWHNFVNAID